jgi:hypothetical protein
LIQWVTRTQAGWMTAGLAAAGVSIASWVASIDMVRLCKGSAMAKVYRFGRPCVIANAIDAATQLRDDKPAGCILAATAPVVPRTMTR